MAALTVSAVIVRSVALAVSRLGCRVRSYYCTIWILMVPSRVSPNNLSQERKRRSQADGWPGIQKAVGIFNPKPPKAATVSVELPTSVQHPGAWNRGLSSRHSVPEVQESQLPLWWPWEHLMVSAGWACVRTNQHSRGRKWSVEPRLGMGKGKSSKNMTQFRLVMRP